MLEGTRRLSERYDWSVWFGLLLLLAGAFYLVSLSIPQYQYHYDGNVFYPWLIFYHGGAFLIIFLVIGIIVGLRLIRSLNAHRREFVRYAIPGLAIFACAASCIISYLPLAPDLEHKATIQFQDKTYHLALSFGSNSDWDYLLAVYIVYECDSLGLICYRYYCPFYESVWYELDKAYQNPAFIVDNATNTLYVQMGSEKLKVRKRCQYGG